MATSEEEPIVKSSTEIENFLIVRVSEITGISVSDIEIVAPLSSLGVTSSHALEIVEELERRMNISIPDTLIWNYPNIDSIARHLAGNAKSYSRTGPRAETVGEST